MNHFLDGLEPGVERIFELALRALELRSGAAPTRFPGARLAAVFLNPSTRTRASVEAAAAMVGAQALIQSPGKDAWAVEMRDGVVMDGDKAEHVADLVRVLAGFADVLAVRAFAGLEDAEEDRSDPVLSAFARYSPVPVINMESAMWHPLQGLADTCTWVSRLGPDLVGQPITLTWAPHPRALPAAVPNQVLLQAAALGMDVTVAHPEGFDLDPNVVARASSLASARRGAVRVVNDQAAGLRGTRVVYAKSWSGFSGYGDRAAEASRRATHGDWTVDAAAMALTDEAGFMHCLPVRRNVVVADEVIDSADSWVYEQAGLRLWSTVALLEQVFAGGEDPWNA